MEQEIIIVADDAYSCEKHPDTDKHLLRQTTKVESLCYEKDFATYINNAVYPLKMHSRQMLLCNVVTKHNTVWKSKWMRLLQLDAGR